MAKLFVFLGLTFASAVATAAFVDECKSGIVWPKPAIVAAGRQEAVAALSARWP